MRASLKDQLSPPLHFLLFINDITDFTKDGSTPSLFVNDTALWIVAIKNKEQGMENKTQQLKNASHGDLNQQQRHQLEASTKVRREVIGGGEGVPIFWSHH